MCWSYLIMFALFIFPDPSSQFGFRIRSPFSVFQTFRKVTREWSDGVAAELIRNATRDNHNPATWLQRLAMICIGGPLDRWFNSMLFLFVENGLLQVIDFCFGAKIWVDGRRTPMLFHSLRKRAEDGLERVSPQHLSTQGPSLGHVRWPCGRPVDWKLGSSENFVDGQCEEFGQFVSSLKFDTLKISLSHYFKHFDGSSMCFFCFGGGDETYFWKIQTDQWKEGGNKRKQGREAAETQATSKAISQAIKWPARQQGKAESAQHVSLHLRGGFLFWRGIFEVTFTSHLLPTRSLKDP